MTEPTSSYLRLHQAPPCTEQPDHSTLADTPEEFWQAFSEATGWRKPRHKPDQQDCMLLPTVDFDPLAGADNLDSIPMVTRQGAMKLAVAGESLVRELSDTRAALRVQEAELASRAMMTSQQQRETIADALEETLADAAAASQCDSAAMYLLDDETKTLKTRAVFGLPPTRIEEPARDLRGSRGDLEAMVQGVICLDNLQASTIDTWNCPEQANSAICASINNDSVPVGTLWLFGNKARDFTSAHGAAARMAAKQLALRLECTRASHDQTSKQQTSDAIRDIAQWQFTGLPLGTKLADGWLVDGMLESAKDWAIGWHTWDVLPDGTLMLAMAEAEDQGLAGTMTSAICRAALTAHTGYRHTPRELLQRISDTLWQTSTSEQLVSLLYARIDPDTGEGDVASAGKITAIISSQYGYRPLVNGESPLLTSNIDIQCEAASFRMTAGEAFLAYGPGMFASGTTQQMLGDQLRSCMQESDLHPLAAIRRSLAGVPLDQERGAISIVRKQ